jgi:hypothetical protein
MTEKITIDGIGTDFRITVKENDAVVDIATATALVIIFEKPSGVEVEKTASLLTDGTDGILHYQREAGVIDEVGIWTYRGKITFSASLVFYTIDPQTFEVSN